MSSDLILHKLNILWERKCCLSLSVLASRTHCSPCRIWPLNEFYEWAKWIVIDDLIFTWKYNAKTWKCAQESIKLNHANLVRSWRKVCLSLLSASVFTEFLQTAASLCFWCCGYELRERAWAESVWLHVPEGTQQNSLRAGACCIWELPDQMGGRKS